ncbi:MAG: phosphoenolpyruvate carboxylase [Thermodesulfobacteriota bacterium]
MWIALEYSFLVRPRDVGKRIFGRIREEYELTEETILRIAGEEAHTRQQPVPPKIHRAQEPLHRFPQLHTGWTAHRLLKGDFTPGEKAALIDDLKLSINGISAGLKNTG